MYYPYLVTIFCIIISCAPVLADYDYIVVGTGAAGSVVAGRLAWAGKKVLVLEAGGPSQRSVGGTDYVAAYGHINASGVYVPDPLPLTRYDVPVFYPTTTTLGPIYNIPNATLSKLVGGNMIHNGMNWIRARPDDIDEWGVTGWAWTDLLPYYIKSENVSGSSVAGDTALHGLSGPIQLSDNSVQPYEAEVFVNACVASGQPFNPDFNGPTRTGCGYQQHNIRRGIRDSSANAYLGPNFNNPNVTLLTFAQATKILFSHHHGVYNATGVQYYYKGEFKTAHATKEVLIAAGGVNTAKLLILSGIGPIDQLEYFGITPISPLPYVGKNIRNHLLVSMQYYYNAINFPNLYTVGVASQQYAEFGTGIFAQGGNPASGFIYTNPALSYPDVDFFFGIYKTQSVSVIVSTAKAALDSAEVTLASADPLVDPHLSSNLLTNQSDIDTLVRGVKAARNISSYEPFRTAFGAEQLPGPTVITDAQIEAWVVANIQKHDHWYGAVRMGNLGDPGASLDPELRVLGVSNLRVVDSSVIPGAIDGLLMATTVAVAEKAADLILNS